MPALQRLSGVLLLLLAAVASAQHQQQQQQQQQHGGHHGTQRRFAGMRHSGTWEAVLAARAHAAASEPGPRAAGQQQQHHAREPQLWRVAMANTMKQVSEVSWWLGWEDLGFGSSSSGNAEQQQQQQQQQQQDNPDLGGKEPDMLKLVRCVNAAHDPRREVDWKGAMRDEEASIKVVGAWWRNHQPADVVTVVTSASVSRLPQLYAQCLSWAGPLSVTLYHAQQSNGSGRLSALNQASLRTAVLQVGTARWLVGWVRPLGRPGQGTTRQVNSDHACRCRRPVQVSQFMLDMQQVPHACKPDVLLVYEMYRDDQARRLLYPFNLVRNLARLQVGEVEGGGALGWAGSPRVIGGGSVGGRLLTTQVAWNSSTPCRRARRWWRWWTWTWCSAAACTRARSTCTACSGSRSR